MLAGGIASLAAASRVLGKKLKLEDCALAALRAGLPQRAQGRVIEASKLTAIHRAAVQQAGEAEGAPMRRIRTLPDHVARVAEGAARVRRGRGQDRAVHARLRGVRAADAAAALPVRAARAAAGRRARWPQRAGVRAAGRADGARSPRMCAQKQHSIARVARRRCRAGTSCPSGSDPPRARRRGRHPARQHLPDAGAGREGGVRRRRSSSRSTASGARCSAASADEREAA